MRKFLLLPVLAALATTLLTRPAQGSNLAGGLPPTEPTAPATTTVIRGKVVSPAGLLPGAVIKLKSTQQTAVANAEGEFQLAVPGAGGPQVATISYAGYEDEEVVLNAGEAGTEVSLAKVHFIKVKRNQRLKVYLKTAHKQARKASRTVRR